MLNERNNENFNVIYMLQHHQYLSNRFKQDISVQN